MQLNSGAEGDGDAPRIPAVSSGNKSFDMDHALHASLQLGNLQTAHQSDIAARHSFDAMGHAATGRDIEKNRRIREEIAKLEAFRQRKQLEEEQMMRKILMEREAISMPRVGLSSTEDGGSGGFHLQGHGSWSAAGSGGGGGGGGVKPIIDLREEQVNGAKDDGGCRNRRIREEMEKEEVLLQQRFEEEVLKKMRMERQMYMSRVGLDLSLVDPTLLSSYVPEVPVLSERDEFGTGIKSGTELAGGVDHDGRLFMAGSSENGGTRDFPFQRQPRSVFEYGAAVKHIIDSRKEQLVSMVKPSSSGIAGMKRVFEAPVPQVVEDNTPSVDLKKNSQEGLICDLCQVAVTSKQTMQHHLNGKKHKAKERALQQGTSKKSKQVVDGSCEDSKGGNKDVDVVLLLTERLEEENASAHDVKERPEESNAADSKFYCRMCNFGTMSNELMADHRMGEHHWTLLQQNGGCVIAIKTTPDHYAGETEDTTAGGDAEYREFSEETSLT